jgi:hypothetical protein
VRGALDPWHLCLDPRRELHRGQMAPAAGLASYRGPGVPHSGQGYGPAACVDPHHPRAARACPRRRRRRSMAPSAPRVLNTARYRASPRSSSIGA